MRPLLRLRTAVCLVVIGVLMAAGLAASPSTAAKAKKASLTVTPGSNYTAGQRLTWSGNIGLTGQRKVRLQFNMARGAASAWTDVDGFSAKTTASGSFKFYYPAPGMDRIYMRVVSGNAATPAKEMRAKSQDLTLAIQEPDPELLLNQVVAGNAFTIKVDTTPVLPHRPDITTQVFPGRKLTLQQRVNGDQWKTIQTSTVDNNGFGTFNRTISDVGQTFPATVTYRVLQGDITSNGNKIGWFPSFPLDVTVFETLPVLPRQSAKPATSRPVHQKAPAPKIPFARDATAAKTNLWGVQLWDFAWEYGESLTSKPFRGSDLKGYWQDSSDGSGRVARHNGQMTLDSGRNWTGPGDYGTTRSTLRGNPAAYGRWETRLRLKRVETGAEDYHAVIELVPDKASDYHCGAQNITVADVLTGGNTVGIGVNTRSGKKWTANKSFKIGDANAAFAVEVSKKHITWFINGKPVGTLKNSTAVSDVPMTLRLSLVGDGDNEMNHTQMHSDWERGWDLNRGKLRMDGASLKAGTFTPGC